MENLQLGFERTSCEPVQKAYQRNIGRAIKHKLDVSGLNRNVVLEIMILVGVAVFLILLIVVLLSSRQYTVQGISMEPTLYEGDRLYYSGFQTYEYGDLIIFKAKKPYGMIVKRVIGIAGDYVLVNADGSVVRNHIPLSEDYIIPDELGNSGMAEVKVADGMIFVLGDNRAGSIDSRDTRIGQIQLDSVYGKVEKIARAFN